MSGENKFVDTSLYKNYSSTEDFFVGIIENWNLALESILLVGSLLSLAKDRLGQDYYELQQRLEVQGISRIIQNRCLNVARCQPLIQYCRKEYEKGIKPLLPNDIKVLNEIATVTKNDSDKFKEALNQGIISSQTTHRDLMSLYPPKPLKEIIPGQKTVTVNTSVLVGSITVKLEKIEDVELAEEIQSSLDDAIKSVVSKYPEVLNYNLVRISELL